MAVRCLLIIAFLLFALAQGLEGNKNAKVKSGFFQRKTLAEIIAILTGNDVDESLIVLQCKQFWKLCSGYFQQNGKESSRLESKLQESALLASKLIARYVRGKKNPAKGESVMEELSNEKRQVRGGKRAEDAIWSLENERDSKKVLQLLYKIQNPLSKRQVRGGKRALNRQHKGEYYGKIEKLWRGKSKDTTFGKQGGLSSSDQDNNGGVRSVTNEQPGIKWKKRLLESIAKSSDKITNHWDEHEDNLFTTKNSFLAEEDPTGQGM
eukprot:gene11938-2509_t